MADGLVGMISFQILRNCLCSNRFLTNIQDYSLRSRNLLNYFTDFSMRVFWISYKRKLENIWKKYLIESLFIKPPQQILFWMCTRRKGCSKFSKIRKGLCKTVLFSVTNMQFITSGFIEQQVPRKMFTVSVLKQLRIFQEKVYNEIMSFY